MITAIAAVSENWGIGYKGELLFHIPEDMKFFRSVTSGHTVVMGRKTLLSFPDGQPLNNRSNVVLSRNADFKPEGVTVLGSVEEVLKYIENADDEVFIIGGGEVYREFLPYCQKALITKVNAAPEADAFFPNLDKDSEWVITERSEEKEHNGIKFRNGTKFRFCTYIRK